MTRTKRFLVPLRACLICGKMFKPHDNSKPGKYCSFACRGIAQRHDKDTTEAERSRQRALEWFYSHPEEAKVRRKAQYARDKRHALDAVRKWRKKNLDKYRANQHVYKLRHYRQHREQYNSYVRNRRARIRTAEGSHDASDVQRQYTAQKGKCYWCGVSVSDTYHVDHVIPLNRGGSNGPENIVIACPHCNESKGDKLPGEWSGSNGKLL